MMTTHRRRKGECDAEILAIGTELIRGDQAETNSLFLSQGLADIGIPVRKKTIVSDEEHDVALALIEAASRAQVVLVSGGLGPTVDDLTREAVAKAVGVPLRQRAAALRMIQAQLARRGRTMMPLQRRQAKIPAGAIILPNSMGTAPGFYLRWRECLIVVLPGVPYEAKAMFDMHVVPLLRERFGQRSPLRRCVIQTFGLSELEVQRVVQPVLNTYPEIQVGLSASPLGVSVICYQRVTSQPVSSPHSIDGQFDSLSTLLDKALGDHVFGHGEDAMESVVGRALAGSGFRIATAESCTGGLISHRLTQVPGSSRYVDRGVICYSNQSKIHLLGVSQGMLRKHGAVSGPVATAMARGIRTQSGVDIGLSVTGIAGPGGGTRKKPVGLVFISLDAEHDRVTRAYQFHDDREGVKLRASQAALNMVRLWVMKQKA